MDTIVKNNPVNNDYCIDTFNDTVESLKFNPSLQHDLLAGISWDKTLKIWSIAYSNQTVQYSQPLTQTYDSNLISLEWIPDQAVLTGSTGGGIYLCDLNASSSYEIGRHEIGVSALCYLKDYGILISAGWDGYLKFWDFKSSTPCHQIDLGGSILTMSYTHPLLVLGLRHRKICYYDLTKLNNISNFTYTALYLSPLKQETKVITTFPDAKGYVIGGTESRAAVQHIDFNGYPDIRNGYLNNQKDFSFSCHSVEAGSYSNKTTHVFPINDIAFNYQYETFCTAGGDGSWVIRDKESKSVLRCGYFENRAPITAVGYNWKGDILAYACGNDWGKGGGKYERGVNSFIVKLHLLTDQEKKKI
jgi:mRNA export factor